MVVSSQIRNPHSNDDETTSITNPVFYTYFLKDLIYSDLPKAGIIRNPRSERIGEIQTSLTEQARIPILGYEVIKLNIEYMYQETLTDAFDPFDIERPIGSIYRKPNFNALKHKSCLFLTGGKTTAHNIIKSLKNSYLDSLNNMSPDDKRELQNKFLIKEKIDLLDFVDYLRNTYGPNNICVRGSYLKDIGDVNLNSCSMFGDDVDKCNTFQHLRRGAKTALSSIGIRSTFNLFDKDYCVYFSNECGIRFFGTYDEGQAIENLVQLYGILDNYISTRQS